MAEAGAALRLIEKRDDQLIDLQEDIELSEFGGIVPQVGDRLVLFRSGIAEGYVIAERIFDHGTKFNYINLVIEPHSVSDLSDLPRFHSATI